MPDNLRVTAPLTTNNRIDTQKSAAEKPVPGSIVPDKVSGLTELQEQNAKDNPSGLLLNRNSAFSKFIEDFDNTPAVSETMQKLLQAVIRNTGTVQYGKTANELIAPFLGGLATDKSGIFDNLTFQQNVNTQFSGAFFGFLKTLLDRSEDAEYAFCLADFLKAYDRYFALPVTMNAVMKNLELIRSRIPVPYKNELEKLVGMLKDQPGSLETNLPVLKNEIIPFLGRYITETNDLGAPRDLAALLMHDISRLHLSSGKELNAKFEELTDYCKYRLGFPDDSINMLKTMFATQIARERNGVKNFFFDSLISLLSGRDTSDLPGMKQTLLHDACRALLLDQSVFMPYTHLFLPLQSENRFSSLDIWIEKKETGRRPKNSAPDIPFHIFVVFDIKDLGSFEASIDLYWQNVSMELSCPPAVMPRMGEIHTGISRIFERNGFKAKSILISGDPLGVGQKIRKKIMERSYSLDVTI